MTNDLGVELTTEIKENFTRFLTTVQHIPGTTNGHGSKKYRRPYIP